MSKFNNLKKKVFILFEKQDKKTHKSDSLSQPNSSENFNNNEDKNLDKAKLIKKIVIWLISIGLLAAIIAPIVVSCTRKTEINLSDNLTTSINGSNLTFTDNDKNKSYTINASDQSSYLSAYFRATSNQVQIKL